MSIDQKSGWRIRRKNTLPTIRKYGINPSKRLLITCLFFFAKYARKMMIPIFMNSTG